MRKPKKDTKQNYTQTGDEEMAKDLGYITFGRPAQCCVCGGSLVYKGVGEYQCSECHSVEYDDYGKVRLYIEAHNGATSAEISDATGVSQAKIRQMLRDERLEVTPDSVAFLHCEICGIDIRSGKYCASCESKLRKDSVAESRMSHSSKVHGFGSANRGEDCKRRFMR